VLINPYLAKLSPRSVLILSAQSSLTLFFFLHLIEYSEYFEAQFRFQDNPSGISGVYRLVLELHCATRF